MTEQSSIESSQELPDSLVGYQHPGEISEKDIDDEIWPLVRSINQTDWMRTTCSCAGHPDSHQLHAWSTDLNLSLAVRADEMVGDGARYDEWLTLIREDAPRELQHYEPGSGWWMFLQSTVRDHALHEYYNDDEAGWQSLKLVFEYETVGQREHMVSLMLLALDEIERGGDDDD